MKYLSVCSGIEAATVAWHPLGWTPVGFSEIEPFPSAVLAHHFPKVKNYGDMSKFRDWPIRAGDIDLLVGGTPCQSFSIAGLRQGLKDPRGNLMLTFLAIAEHLRPKWILWENVPGVLSSNGSKDFGCFLGGLGELGYGFAYRILDAQWCRTHGHPRAVPQRRRRVFVVGCLGDATSAAKVLFERESLQRYSAPRRSSRQGTAADAEGGVGGGGVFTKSKRAQSSTDDEGWVEGVVAPTQNAFDVGDVRTTTIMLQPFDQQKMGVYGSGEVGSAVVARGYKSATDIAVLQPIAFPIQDGREIEKKQNGLGIGDADSPAYTIDQTGAQAIAIQGTVIGRQDHNGPAGSGHSDNGEMFTLNATDRHAVACGTDCYNGAITGDVAATIGTPGSSVNASGPTVMQAMQVRRLTPTECERLQGFPDGWTSIPWKKKIAEDCPDGPRYKALGNSMAVNCMEWLGERIENHNRCDVQPVDICNLCSTIVS